MPRYQAAILRGKEILLIQHREYVSGRAYWIVPGGGREAAESEIDCVRREAKEETNLDVEVAGLLLEDHIPDPGSEFIRHYKTYLCRPLSNDAAPGCEPEPEVAAIYAIAGIGWFNIYDESTWNESIRQDVITAPTLRKIRAALEKGRFMP